MALREFDVHGEEISDEETEEIVKPGDPRRSLVRYRPDGSELFVSARINLPLLRAAVALPVLLLKPSSRDDEVLKPNDPALEAAGGWDLLAPEGSRRNWGFLERICEDLAEASVPACYLADSMARTGAISTSSPRTSPAWSGSPAPRRKRCPFRWRSSEAASPRSRRSFFRRRRSANSASRSRPTRASVRRGSNSGAPIPR